MLLLGMQSMAQTSRLDSIHTLRDVDVVGVRPHYLTPSQTLQGTMLQDLSTTSVADALKYFSGVQIKDYGGLGGLKTVNVRSLGSQHVGVYLDGIRINNAQNGQIDLGRYSLSNMESVSLYNANRNERLQSASEYASAATVYMQTRRPAETAYSVEYGCGSFGLNKVKGYFSLKNLMFVDAEYQHTKGNYGFRFRSEQEDTVGRRNNSDITFYLQDPNTNASTMFCDNHYTQQDIYGSIAGAWNTRYLSLTASTDLRWTDLNADVYKFAYVYRIDSKSLLSAIASYRGFEANVALLYTHISDHTRSAASPLSSLAPMYLASWHGGPWTVRAFHKRIFRAPTLNDLYYTLVGNVQLRPEYTSQWDMGVDYKDKYLHLALDMYYNRIEDKIVAIPMKCQFRWSMVNFGLVKSLGLSATAGYDRQWGKFSLSTNANYTCQRDRDYSSPADPEYKNTIPYSPLHSASLILDLGYNGYSLCTSWLYTGDRFALISNNREDMLGDWYTVDLKLNKQFSFGKQKVQATIECNNLTDSRHEVVKRYPMPGRNWKFTLQWRM